MPQLSAHTTQGVTLHGDERRPGGVTFAFTERAGGVSQGSLASLNLGDRVGDESACVAENRRRACAALGFEHLAERLICPRQVHGTNIVTISDGGDDALAEARSQARAGADAIVCCAKDVPALICVADCVPVVLVCEGAFAVVHSGWRGTIDEICGHALNALVDLSSCAPSQVQAYIGPHIQAADYEVSAELADRFVVRFGEGARLGERNLSLAHAIRVTLAERGVAQENIAQSELSTASNPERLFSFRASAGSCGRQGALACLVGEGDAR